ncbi:MAG TPA: DUF58 domain-containing protein, partial [Thermoanaerobaculia bacterium]|nr:DUF58 domain-containing protein [Thermoanaerobaculia bacterium]
SGGLKPAAPWQFNGVVRLTKVGTTYILGTIVLAVAAINTGNNAIYIGVAFMLGCLLLSGIASKGGLKHLHVDVGAIDEAWAGRPADGTLRVRNASRVWNVRDVVFVSPELADPVLVPILPRKQELVIPVRFLFHRRGLAELKTLDSYTRYPFGFFLKKRRLRVHSEVVVYPRLHPESLVQEQFRSVAGQETSEPRPGEGTEIHSFRDYTRGDSLRHVHWKKSASLGRWIMKQNEAEGAHAVQVIVDPYKPRGVSSDAFEEMISDAATFIFDAAARGLEVTLTLPRVDVRSRDGLFRALALVEPVYEPVEMLVDRNAVYFSAAGGHHDAKSA